MTGTNEYSSLGPLLQSVRTLLFVMLTILCIIAMPIMADSPKQLFKISLGREAIYPSVSVSDDGLYALAGDTIIDIEKKQITSVLPVQSDRAVIEGYTGYLLSSQDKAVHIYDLTTGVLTKKIPLPGAGIAETYSTAISRAPDGTIVILGNDNNGEVSKNVIYRISPVTQELMDDGYAVPLPEMKVHYEMRKPVVGQYTALEASQIKRNTTYLMGSYTYQYVNFELDTINEGIDILAEFNSTRSGNLTQVGLYPLDHSKAKHDGMPNFPSWLPGYSAQCGQDLWMLATDLNRGGLEMAPQYNALTQILLTNHTVGQHVWTEPEGGPKAEQWSASWTKDCRYVYLFNYDTRGQSDGQRSSIIQYDSVTRTFAHQTVQGEPYDGVGDHGHGYQYGAVSECDGEPCLLTIYDSFDHVNKTKVFRNFEAYAIPWK